MQKKDEWLRDRVAYLKGLKSPTDQQSLLVLLAENPARTARDEKKLAALVRAEKASQNAAKARQKVTTLLQAEKRAAKDAERKARNHRLIQQGLLFDLAGLSSRSRGEMLGLLLAAASTVDEHKWASWKVRGDAILAETSNEAPATQQSEQGVPK